MVKKLRAKCGVWQEQGCQGFEESSDEEDEECKREPDEKFKARVASITQSAMEWKLKRQNSSLSRHSCSRNGSAVNLQHSANVQTLNNLGPNGIFIVDKAKSTQV